MSAPLPGNVITRPWRLSRRWSPTIAADIMALPAMASTCAFAAPISAAPAGCRRYISPIGCTLRRGTAIPAQKSPSPAIVATS